MSKSRPSPSRPSAAASESPSPVPASETRCSETPSSPVPSAPEQESTKYATRENERVPVVCEPAAVYDVEADPAASWPWGDELEDVLYSIRIPVPAGEVRCARCRALFSAAGPTGYAEDSPICDMCLLEGCQELGMVLALVAVVRAFGRVRPSGHGDYREALNELGAFCRIYEQFAAKAGPPRIFRVPGLAGEWSEGD